MPHKFDNMDIYKSHQNTIKEVLDLLLEGKKHITLIVPTGAGSSKIALEIAKELLDNPVIITSKRIVCEQLKRMQCEVSGNSDIPIVPATSLFKETSYVGSADIVCHKSFILFNTDFQHRQLLSSVLPISATVVSFDNVFKYNDSVLTTNFESIVLFSDTILDARDIVAANHEDRAIVSKQISEKIKVLNKQKFITASAPICASPDASEEEIKELKRRLKQKEDIIAEKDETIHILELLLRSAGISQELLQKSIDIIKKAKKKFADDETEESANKIAEVISEQCLKLFSGSLTTINKDLYAAQIKSHISDAVWDKLESTSKTCLITGKIAYQSLINANNGTMDYSGVCILASKALDIEMSKRFFVQYLEYLKQNYDYKDWPDSLLDKNGYFLTDDKFTLGRIKYVVGMDKDGKTYKDTYRLFFQYAKKHLYPSSFSQNDIYQHLKKSINIIETVRVNYRNPAAHRESINQITAKECLEYLIDTYRKIKEILEVIE